MVKPVGTLDDIAQYLILGYYQDKYGPNATSTKWSDPEIPVDLSRLDAKGQFLARTALDMWSSATGLAFKEVSINRDDARGDNDRGILFKYGASTKAVWHSYGSQGWISWSIDMRKSTQANAVGTNESGEYTVIGPMALYHFIHEIGHALGLGHPGNYNGGGITYLNDAKFANDSVQVSTMSYFGSAENPTLDASLAYPVTPMSADILAIEKLYGDSNAIRTDDTVYGFNSTAGGFLDDLAGQMNAGGAFTFTLIDDGGSDTFDYSGTSRDSRVDLNPGAVSDIFGGKGNMVIYRDTVIEHVVGGGGADNVTGNDANNLLRGGAGDDTLDGGAGDDLLVGGTGADSLTGGAGADTFRYPSSAFGADTITDFEDGSDIIDLAGSGLRFSDLTIGDNGQDKIVNAGSGNTITLTGQAGATIDATDFSFTAKALQVSIEDTSIAEGGVARFVLRLSELSDTAVSVDWRTRDGAAVAGEDFTGASAWQTVTFAPGQLAKTIEVQTSSDDVFEPDETFSVELGNPVGATIADGTGEASIENATPVPGISIDDVEVNEGGAATFSVSLDRVSYLDVTVEWRTEDGRAVSGDDYTGVGQARSLVIPAGQRSATVSVQTLDNSKWKSDNHFLVTLRNPVDATIADGTGKGVIIENDPAHPTVSISDGTGSEGGAVTFEVSLDKVWQTDVTVNLSLGNGGGGETAEQSVDFKVPDESSITIPAGRQSAEFKVRTFYDKYAESDETFTVSLQSPGDEYPLGRSTATGTIQNVDESLLPTPPTVSLADVTATESDGTVRVPVHFDRAVEPGERIFFRMRLFDGSAEIGRDFWRLNSDDATRLYVVEGNGTNQAFIPYRLVNDNHSEGDERFVLEIFNVDGAFLADGTSTVTILDDDAPKVAPYVFVSGSPDVVEGNTAVFTVRLGHRMTQDVTVNWVLSGNGTATGGEDYDNDPASGTVTIPAGELFAPVIVETYADNQTEDTETFYLTLTSASGAIPHHNLSRGRAEIHDDGISNPGIGIRDVTVTEGGTAHLFVTLRHPSDGTVLDWSTSDGTATQGDDYVAVTDGRVFIPLGATSAHITIDTNVDNLLEGSETFTVTLSNPRGRGYLEDATATVTIVDGPTPPRLSIDDVTVAEGDVARFTVSLERTSAEDVTFTWATSEGSAQDGSDYTGQSGQTLTIPAGRHSAGVTVQTTGDRARENDETFTVTLGSPAGAIIGDGTGLGTIKAWHHNGLVLTGTNAFDYLRGSNSNDLIDGRGGPDRIEGGLGDDRMTGGGGADRFILAVKQGHDVITDFNPDGGDTISFVRVGFSSFSEMLESHAEQDGDDVVIHTGSGRRDHSLTLLDVQLSELEASQFTIVEGSEDDSAPSLSIGDVIVTEGGVARFTIQLDAVSGKDVSVNWSTSDGTAIAGSDYTAQAGQSVTIAAGQQSATVSVQTADDSDDETSETFTVELSGAINATIGDATGEASIIDNDVPPPDNPYAALIAKVKGYAAETQHGNDHQERWKQVLAALGEDNGYTPMAAAAAQTYADKGWTRWDEVVVALTEIEAEQAAEQTASTPPVASIDDVTVTEGGQARFTVTLDKTWSDDVTLAWDTSDGTATNGGDYTGQSGQTLTIAAGQQSAMLNVQTTGDNLDEDDETFTVTLGSPGNATLGDDTGKATITDDDASPQLSIDDVAVAEGGVAQFTIQLDAVSGKDVTFNWTTSDGTATAGSDYTAQTGQSVIIAAGQQSATVSVQTTDDGDDEASETFTVELSGATSATIGDATGEASIIDNDVPPPDNPYAALIAKVKGYAAETQHGNDHQERWKQVLAALGEDNGYTPMAAAAAQTYADKGWTRWDEVVVALTEIEAEQAAEQTASTPPVASIDDVTVTEGGQARFTVTLDKTWSDDVTLAWDTSDGTATNGGDYTGQSGQTLTIAAGQQSAMLNVQTTGDNLDEDDETFTVTLGSPGNATLGDDTGKATITDDDAAPALSIDDVTITEGGVAQFTIQLDAVSGKDVTFNWATSDGTAAAGSDYTARASQSVTIVAGRQSALVSVQTTDDGDDEANETFTVTLSGVTNASFGDDTGEVTIIDNDDAPPPPPPPVLPFASINDVTVTEGEQARFTVSLDKTWTSNVTLIWSTADGTATDGGDYTGQSGQTLIIAAGEQSATLDVQTTDDSDDENDETFIVTLGSPTNATIGDGSGLGTIEDNDDAPDPDPDQWNHNGLTLTGTNGFDYLRGSNLNDLIDGRGGPDRIEGGFGDDRMTGGKGADSFIIPGNRGHDVITDFSPDEGDLVILSGPNFSSFGKMLENHVEQDGDDVVIHTSPSREDHSLTLLDTQISELDAAQFRIIGGTDSSAVTSAQSQATAFVGQREPLFLRVDETPVPADHADFFMISLAVFSFAESRGDLIW